MVNAGPVFLEEILHGLRIEDISGLEVRFDKGLGRRVEARYRDFADPKLFLLIQHDGDRDTLSRVVDIEFVRYE